MPTQKDHNGPNDITIVVTPSPNEPHSNNQIVTMNLSPPGSRRMTGDNVSMAELALASRNSSMANALRRPSNTFMAQRKLMLE